MPKTSVSLSGLVPITASTVYANSVGVGTTVLTTTPLGTLLASNISTNVLAVAGSMASSNLNLSGNLIVWGKTQMLGTQEIINSYTTISSNLVVNNFGTGPALQVTQNEATSQPLAQFVAGSTQSLYLSSTGLVGLGTTSPYQKLDIYNGGICMRGTGAAIGVGTTNPTASVDAYASGTGSMITNTMYATSQYVLKSNSPSLCIYDQTGAVSANGYLRIGVNNQNANNGSPFTTNTLGDAYIAAGRSGYGANIQLGSYTTADGNGVPTMTITPAKVGIANTSPSYTLDVTGTIRATSTVTAPLFNSSSGTVTLTTTQTTLFTLTSGTSGLLVITPNSATLTKGLWFVEYTTNNDYCTVTQLCQPVGGSYTITCSAGTNYIAAVLNTGSGSFNWRVVQI